jgi:hypothetical protein
MLASIPARTLNPIRSRRGIPRFSLFGKCSSRQQAAILPDRTHKNNEAGLRNPAETAVEWSLFEL